MEPILALVGGLWWIVPTAVGLGAVSFGVLTSGKRRARRIELDAARHGHSVAYHELTSARARLQSAKADMLSAKAAGPASTSGEAARRELQSAKLAERAAMLAVRAARTRVKATTQELHTRPSDAPLPLAKLMAEHDAVTLRWLVYETDAEMVLAFPQMSDARHPATRAFLQAQRSAASLRPSSSTVSVKPAQFHEYREAVRRMEATLLDAERAAGAAAPDVPRIGPWTLPAWWMAPPPPRGAASDS